MHFGFSACLLWRVVFLAWYHIFSLTFLHPCPGPCLVWGDHLLVHTLQVIVLILWLKLFSWYGGQERGSWLLITAGFKWIRCGVFVCCFLWDSRAVFFVSEVTTFFFFSNCIFFSEKSWWILIYLYSFWGGREKNIPNPWCIRGMLSIL